MITETATVYRVGRFRYFTKRAALQAMARQWIKARCDCEKPSGDFYDGGYPGSVCKYHVPDRYPSLLARLTQLAKKHVASSGLKEGATNE